MQYSLLLLLYASIAQGLMGQNMQGYVISGAVPKDIEYTTVDATDDVGQYSSITINAGNHPSISYYDNTNDNLKVATFNGSSWDIQVVAETGDQGRYTSYVIDSDNKPNLIYYDATLGKLKYAGWLRTWEYTTVDADGDVGQYSSITINTSNQPSISYYDATNKDLKVATYNGTTWEKQIVDADGDRGRYTSYVIDSDNKPNLIYYDATLGKLKYAGWLRTWEYTTVDADGDVGQYSSITINTSNQPSISYYDVSNKNLKVATYNGTSWEKQIVDADGDRGRYTSYVIDADNNPNLIYYDATRGKLKYAGWLRTWEKTTVDHVGDVGQYSSIACDEYNQVYISYYDATNANLKFASNLGSSWQVETIASEGSLGRYTSLDISKPQDGNMAHVIYYNQSEGELQCAIKGMPTGTLPGNLAFSSNALDFGQLTIGDPGISLSLEITNTGGGSTTLTEIAISGSCKNAFSFSGLSAPVTIASGNTKTIDVQFNPVESGLKSANIAFSYTGGYKAIPLSGVCVGSSGTLLTFSPSSLNFGQVLPASINNLRTIQITNESESPSTLSGIEINGANTGDFSYAGITPPMIIEPGAVTAIQVIFDPEVAGIKSANLDFTYDGTDVSIPLSGECILELNGLADLRPLGVVTDEENLISGQTATFNVYIQNTGDLTVASHSVQLLLTPPRYGREQKFRTNPEFAELITEDSELLTEFTMDAISPGETCNKELEVDIPYLNGDWYISLLVDNDDAIAESDETNNLRISKKSKQFINTTTADLTGTIITSAKEWSSNGRNVSLSGKVMNQGTSNAGFFKCSFYLSSDEEIDENDTKLSGDEIYYTGIPAMESINYSKEFLISSNIPLGSYYVGIIIDSENHIDEDDKGNNIVYQPQTINVVEPTGFLISGTVNMIDALGVEKPLAGVLLGGLPNSPVSDANGYYEVEVPIGWAGAVDAHYPELQFLPASRHFYSVHWNREDMNFTGINTLEIVKGIQETQIVAISDEELGALTEFTADAITRMVVGNQVPDFIEDVKSLHEIYKEDDEIKQYFQMAAFVVGKVGFPIGEIVSTYLKIGAEIIDQYRQLAGGYYDNFLKFDPNEQLYFLEISDDGFFSKTIPNYKYQRSVEATWYSYNNVGGQYNEISHVDIDIKLPENNSTDYVTLNLKDDVPSPQSHTRFPVSHVILLEWKDRDNEVVQKSYIPVSSEFLHNENVTKWTIKIKTNRSAFSNGFYRYLNIVTP